jgi:adenylate cyclase
MTRGHRRRLRVALVLLAGVVSTALALVALATGVFRVAELDTVDARFKLRGKSDAPPRRITVVAIDDISFAELGQQWPFPRSVHARVIDRLTRAGAAPIAYDVQFTEPTSVPDDNALVRAVGRAHGRVVLATTEVDAGGRTAVLGGDATLRSLGARAGHGSLPPDIDGINRRFPYAVDGLPSLAVATAEAATHHRVRRERFDERGTAWIDYAGPPGAVPTFSFSRVMKGKVDPAAFRGSIVVVGVAAPTLQDVHPTSASGGELMSGPEIQANAIATALRDIPLREPPGWLGVALTVLLGFACPLLTLRRGAVTAIAGSTATGALYAAATQLAFDHGLILPFVIPIGGLVVSAVATTMTVLALDLAAAGFERERVRELFARFVPARVVEEVLARHPSGDLRLGGKRLQATIVFCDIRGFTAFAELRPAEQVIEVLNRYLSEMSEAIRAHEGTLLAYRGDGVLAAFGAPVEQFDDADRAIQAVREMAGHRLAELNVWLRRANLGEGFRIGIGVNSGVIMSGNVGCDWRLEYTAIGDTVNTASRLEVMTKDSPHQVLISDTTRAMLRREAPDLRYVDAMHVRGKQIKVNLWTLDLEPSIEAPAEAARAQREPTDQPVPAPPA